MSESILFLFMYLFVLVISKLCNIKNKNWFLKINCNLKKTKIYFYNLNLSLLDNNVNKKHHF